jgi:hypothetical protein
LILQERRALNRPERTSSITGIIGQRNLLLPVTDQNLGFSQKGSMLFLYQNHLVDVVHESPYPRLFTVRASSTEGLNELLGSTSSEIVQVPHHIYPYLIHVHEDQFPIKVSHQALRDIEVVDRLTPEPTCFTYEYCYASEDDRNIGEYGYCWPNEVGSTREYLMSGEREILGEPVFLPLFRIPGELVNAPAPYLEGEFNLSGDEDIDDEQTDN